MRLVESSDMSGEEVDEYNRRQDLRRRFEEEAILMSALCRELKKEADTGRFPSTRSETAYGLLTAWRENVYGPHAEGTDARDVTVLSPYHPGQVIGSAAERQEVAPELVEETRLGAAVCDDLEMVYSAGCGNEYTRDVETLRESLDRYLRHVG